MSKLTALNLYSSSTVTYGDNRPPLVKFNWPTARNIVNVIKDTTVFDVQRSIEIDEIHDPYGTIDISFEVDVSAVSGATVTWDTIPAGCSVSHTDGVFKITNIDTVDIWNTVKIPYITLPSTFRGSFIYECSIKWYTNDGLQVQTWSVGTYLPEAYLDSTATLSVPGKRIRSMTANLQNTMSMDIGLKDIALVGHFDLEVFTINFNRTSASMSSEFTFDLYAPFVIDIARTYNSKVANYIFATNTPYVQDKNPGSSTFDLILITTGNCTLNTDINSVGTTSITLSGTLSDINNELPNVILYPDYSHSSSLSVEWILQKDSVTIDDGEIYFSHAGAGTLTTNYYTFNNSGTLNLPYDEYLYGIADLLLVGGGGGAPTEGGGGGGGGVYELSGVSISSQSYPIVIGVGGARNLDTPNCISAHGGDGNDTTAFGYTAYGGQGGKRYECYTSPPASTTWNKYGGESGLPSRFVGETESGTVAYQYSADVGGGGGGASEVGGTNGTGYGGDGKISTIFGGYFGGGGAGYSAPQGEGGGLGGGGDLITDTNGVANTGGGGGSGFGTSTYRAGNGGSGVVKVKIRAK